MGIFFDRDQYRGYNIYSMKKYVDKKRIMFNVIVTILTSITLCLVIYYVIDTKLRVEKLKEYTTQIIDCKDELERKKKEEEEKKAKIPQLTEQGKENLKNIYKGEVKRAFLTFDDGPSKNTKAILDILKENNIKATFFVLGHQVEVFPETTRRIYDEGHYIANHGYSHIYGNIYSSPYAVLEEYNKTKDVIKEILGTDYDGHLFRFPGGSTGGKYKQIKKDAKTILDENNIAYIDWNSLSNDAAGAKTKEAIIQNTIDTVGNKNSVVILMHDAGDKILTYEALPDIITYLREQGYVFKNFYSVIK